MPGRAAATIRASGRREEVAQILACAAGHMGSCAMYLYQTVAKLEEHGIHDRHLWHLQELVAAEIARTIHEPDADTRV